MYMMPNGYVYIYIYDAQRTCMMTYDAQRRICMMMYDDVYRTSSAYI